MVPILNLFQIEFLRLPNQSWVQKFESARVQSFFGFYWIPETILLFLSLTMLTMLLVPNDTSYFLRYQNAI